jgi:hypothetical protein
MLHVIVHVNWYVLTQWFFKRFSLYNIAHKTLIPYYGPIVSPSPKRKSIYTMSRNWTFLTQWFSRKCLNDTIPYFCICVTLPFEVGLALQEKIFKFKVYLYYFAIITPWRTQLPFISLKLNYFHKKKYDWLVKFGQVILEKLKM